VWAVFCFNQKLNHIKNKVFFESITMFWIINTGFVFTWLKLGSFTKLFMHVSNRNMFPTTRNLQIRVQVYRPCHYCGNWLTCGCFVPMIVDHSLVEKSFIFRVYNIRIIATTQIGSHAMIQTDSSIIIVRNVCVLTSPSMIFSFSSRGHDRQSLYLAFCSLIQ
jgi:hypothetical protein